jgi:metal-sulfur cluster biosynthetic enzyme
MDLSQRELAAGVSPAALPTCDDVRAALNSVIDPCSVIAGAPGGLDDMGLVRAVDVQLADGSRTVDVDVVIGVTEPTCLMGALFLRDAEAALRRLDGVGAVLVRLDHTLIYDTSMQRPEFAVRLGAARRERGVIIDRRK